MRCTVTQRITVGRLGELEVAPGYYIYTGSALGPGGLAARLRRHLSPSRIEHWHVDYLRQAMSADEVWYCVDAARHEHEWALLLAAMPGTSIPMERFGASDCHCPAHLFHTSTSPELPAFRAMATASGVVTQRMQVFAVIVARRRRSDDTQVNAQR